MSLTSSVLGSDSIAPRRETTIAAVAEEKINICFNVSSSKFTNSSVEFATFDT